jgi:hypothetical protein
MLKNDQIVFFQESLLALYINKIVWINSVHVSQRHLIHSGHCRSQSLASVRGFVGWVEK